MWHPKLAAPLLAGALLLGGTTACGTDEPTEIDDGRDVTDEDISPGVDTGVDDDADEEEVVEQDGGDETG